MVGVGDTWRGDATVNLSCEDKLRCRCQHTVYSCPSKGAANLCLFVSHSFSPSLSSLCRCAVPVWILNAEEAVLRGTRLAIVFIVYDVHMFHWWRESHSLPQLNIVRYTRQSRVYMSHLHMHNTYRCTLRWPLRHATLRDNYRQISQKWCIAAGEMYSTICVEWAVDHFGLGLT